MLSPNVKTLFERIKARVNCKNVKFSKPPLTPETSVHTPSRYSVGGLREHGEWLSTFSEIKRTFDRENMDINLIFATKTGESFIKSLSDRVYSLNPADIYEILLSLHIFNAKLEHFEAILLNELKDSLDDLTTLQLFELPTLTTRMDESFSKKFEQVLFTTFIAGASYSLIYSMYFITYR
ncbi:uncharacterized protein TA05405 [Theileria annulata]|uniref:Uncharacterized protein n=1 Tax=Theileria annulata TaxID=5874 RepID=Q4UCS3_THEAN|nr:uncharacterized protein TA05405 [Theileria annulata]CAI75378.1 hypothetical protein TA05405 [Theileria annulata]|eukprot:XP_954854.1 hypothetical protein TA05405 [Theileria annulata]